MLESAAPFQFSLGHVETGREAWLARIRTTGRVRLGVIFLVEADTRSARNHSWVLGAGKTAQKEALTAALGYGRSGQF
jgi:hypothetical protein